MPRNVRNFWVTAFVDGRKDPVEFGPRSKDGEFTLQILVREDSCVSERKVVITGHCAPDGSLMIEADVTGQSKGIVLLASQR